METRDEILILAPRRSLRLCRNGTEPPSMHRLTWMPWVVDRESNPISVRIIIVSGFHEGTLPALQKSVPGSPAFEAWVLLSWEGVEEEEKGNEVKERKGIPES